MSELTDAIQKGDAARVTELIEADPALLQSHDSSITPILTSIYYGKNDIARLLVERGAPVSFAEACALGDLERVEQQLAEDPNALHVSSSEDRKSTRLNSSHGYISYAVFCLKKKKKRNN